MFHFAFTLSNPHLFCQPHALSNEFETGKERGSRSPVRICFRMTLSTLILMSLSRTGVHTVADVFCLGCNEKLGWYYMKASDNTQKYKEGGFPVWTSRGVLGY